MPEQTQTPAEEFPTILDSLPLLIKPEITTEGDGDLEFEYPSYNGKVRNVRLQPEISELSGLGHSVTCDIVGDSHTGVAVIMRSRNPFSKRRYGFFIQPEGPEGRIFTFWHGPARQPKKGDWIGADLLDHYTTTEATPDIAAAFALTIEQAAQDRKKPSSNRQ